MYTTWQPSSDYRSRPVTVLGAGVLGRRVGCIWASAGYHVRIRDPSPEQRAAAMTYIKENVAMYAEKTGQIPGHAEEVEGLEDAVTNAWLVIEAVPEKIQLKIDTFAELAAVAPSDCILASNSSSYKTSEMLGKVPADVRSRVLNTHYYMPPTCMIVELMTDGHTYEGIFPFLVERSKEAALIPYVARKESTGFIFNRLWAAVKREVLAILAEGVSVPEEIDSMWKNMFIEGGSMPCAMMDNVGLDTVAFIENNYIQERGLSSEKTVDFLKKHYLDHGKLGSKCDKGGLYPPPATNSGTPKLLVLDAGISGASLSLTAGKILEMTADGKQHHVVLPNQALPDGIAVDPTAGRMFWTCMGIPGKSDGAVYSANLDGTDIRTVVAPGVINTPKQLAIDCTAGQLYFSDREGLRVYRCKVDGNGLETLVSNGSPETSTDPTKWCVGIAVAPKFGKFYWTQKGPSKGGQGRIFCADITPSTGRSGDARCIVSGLPEPIDLEIDQVSGTLYWTDRGELPFGNSLNRVRLDESGIPSQQHEIICRNFNETIGLKLEIQRGYIYLTDLGGSIYRCDLDGRGRERLFSDDSRAFTGITLI